MIHFNLLNNLNYIKIYIYSNNRNKNEILLLKLVFIIYTNVICSKYIEITL